jgi:exonuclease SbcD
MKVKFAHLADCHLGAWRNENLNTIGYQAFERAIDKIIEEKVDFVIISGDLYDVSNPKVDVVDLATKELKKLKDNGIPVYGIMGSHDFSPSDKSMLRPLISADLFKDVSKGLMIDDDTKLRLIFTEDPKTKIKLTGLRARKRSLEIEDYQILDLESLEREKGIKIFLFHTLLSELKPIEFKDMKSAPKSFLPQNFIYYAGGHMHKTLPEGLRESTVPININKNANIIYPGALYPVNFRELEQYHYGGFCMISGEINLQQESSNLKVQYVPIKAVKVISLHIDCKSKSVMKVQELLDNIIRNTDFSNKIVTLRIYGTLSSGKSYELKINEITQKIKEKGAYEVLVNKAALSSKEYEPISKPSGKTNKEIEATYIHEHAQKIAIKNINKKEMENKLHNLLEILGRERDEGTMVKDYDKELIADFNKLFLMRKKR